MQENHLLWRLKSDDIEHLRRLFRLNDETGSDSGADLDPPWDIGNPFRVFAAIPAEARYRFLLENAEVILGGITYGPACNGQTATYAVKGINAWNFRNRGDQAGWLDLSYCDAAER